MLAQGASAAEIGGLLKSDRVSLADGESASVTMLLWGGAVELSLSASAPEGLLVVLQPETVSMASGSERVASGSGYVPAARAKVLVKAVGARPGDYVVPIVARAPPSGDILSFSPSIALNLFVEVRGEREGTVSVDIGPREAVVYGSTPARSEGAREDPTLLYVLVAVSILAVSCIIYRYA